MIGLEKVTDRILAEARAEADRLLDDAKAKKAEMDAQTDEKIAVLRAEMQKEVAEESANVLSRARSTAEMQDRNIVLSQKCASLDATFAAAEEQICAQSALDYIPFIVSLAAPAIRASVPGSNVAVSLNEKDTAAFGKDIVKALGRTFPDRTFDLSGRTAPISGGMILDFGETDVDCSVATALRELRPALEGPLCVMLFESAKNK